MPNSLLTIPYELREQVLTYLLYREDNIGLHHASATRDHLMPPIVQVCKLLREEAIGIFYHVNTFEWTIDPDTLESANPTYHPAANLIVEDESRDAGRSSVFLLPRLSGNIIAKVRQLKLNLYLPNPYDKRLWENTLSERLIEFVQAINDNERLRDLKIMIATWYHFHGLSIRQAAVLDILGQIRVQGHVQVKTRSIDEKLRVALQNLDLTKKMRDDQLPQFSDRCSMSCEVIGKKIDWSWEGGIVI